MRIVAAATPAEGHVRPVLQVAAHLAAAGHEVVMLTGPRWAELVTAAGVKFEPLRGDALVDVDGADFRDGRNALQPGPDQLNYDFIRLYADTLPSQHSALQHLLTPESVLICDIAFSGAYPVLLGAPGTRPALAIGLGISLVTALSEDTTPLAGPLGHDEAARAAHRDANAALVAALNPFQQRLERAARACGATQQMGYVGTMWDTIWDVTAQLCVEEFEYPRHDLPEEVRFVGPLPEPRFETDALPDWWGELEGGRPVVLVSQGTIANDDLTQLVVPTVRALADTDALVVAALGRDISALDPLLDRVPDNVRVVEFVPFWRLLPHVDVMVTNGGYGATQQALRHGVPLVVGGDGQDKPYIAARVHASDTGLDLGTGRPSVEQIAHAVTAVRTDTRVQQGIRRMTAAIAASDALGAIGALVEAASNNRTR